MNYNFNVLIMLCDKISIIVFERNSFVLLKSDHLSESTASLHTMPRGGGAVLAEGLVGERH